jgi:hypothetical protein
VRLRARATPFGRSAPFPDRRARARLSILGYIAPYIRSRCALLPTAVGESCAAFSGITLRCHSVVSVFCIWLRAEGLECPACIYIYIYIIYIQRHALGLRAISPMHLIQLRSCFCVLYLCIYVAPRIGRRNLRLNFWPCSVLLFGLRPTRMRPEGECGAGAQHKHVIVQSCMFVVVRYIHDRGCIRGSRKRCASTLSLAW